MVDYQHLYDDMPAPRFQVRREPDKRLVLSVPNARAASFFGDLDRQAQQQWFMDALLSEADYHEFSRSFDVCMSTAASVPTNLQPLAPLPSGARRAARPFTLFPAVDSRRRLYGVDVVGSTSLIRRSTLQDERDDALLLMSSVFDMSEVGIVVTDEHQKIVRVNRSIVRHFGWHEDDLIGQDITGFVTPDVRQTMVGGQQALDADQGGPSRGSGELRVIRRDGSVANVLFTAAAMELSGNRMFQVYTLMDITLRKRMEETLRAAKERADSASQAKSVFLANMSHELRTPLNAIMGFSEIMIEETFGGIDNERYAGYIRDIHGSAAHLLDIINEVLDMSKIESGKIELDESWVRIEEVVQSVLRMMESRAFGKNIVFCSDFAKALPDLLCDGRILRQVFINLIMNAVKFSDKGGTIMVQAEMGGSGEDWLRVAVIDEGVGIPDDQISRVLEPFGQVDDTDEYLPQEGTGLGLPLAKAMVELHDGQLELSSKLGLGTRVIVSFPPNRLRPQDA